jgi:hypothetical protein
MLIIGMANAKDNNLRVYGNRTSKADHAIYSTFLVLVLDRETTIGCSSDTFAPQILAFESALTIMPASPFA